MPVARSSTSKSPPTRVVLVRIGGLALILAVASLIAYALGLFDYRHAAEHISNVHRTHNTVVFATLFVLAYAGATSVGVPALPFTVAAGVLFGALPGAALSWLSAVLGAAGGYVLARTIAHDAVLKWLTRRRRIRDAVEDCHDFSGMLRLRLIPVLPLGAISFAAGLSKAPFLPYIAATALGVLPVTLVYSYFAGSIMEGIASGKSNALASVVIASALLIGLSLIPRRAKSPPPVTTSDRCARSGSFR